MHLQVGYASTSLEWWELDWGNHPKIAELQVKHLIHPDIFWGWMKQQKCGYRGHIVGYHAGWLWYIYIMYIHIYTYSISNMIWRSPQIGNLLPNFGHFNRENYDQQVDLGYTLFWNQKKWTGGIVLVFLMLNDLPSSFLILCFWLLDFLVGHRSLALFGGCRLAC